MDSDSTAVPRQIPSHRSHAGHESRTNEVVESTNTSRRSPSTSPQASLFTSSSTGRKDAQTKQAHESLPQIHRNHAKASKTHDLSASGNANVYGNAHATHKSQGFSVHGQSYNQGTKTHDSTVPLAESQDKEKSLPPLGMSRVPAKQKTHRRRKPKGIQKSSTPHRESDMSQLSLTSSTLKF